MTSRWVLAFVILCGTLTPVHSQTPQPTKPQEQDDVVKITTNLVQVDAVVTKDGKPVRDLKAEDFEIYEDGKKQEISTFAFISNVGGSPSTKQTDPSLAPPVTSTKLNPDEPRRIIALVVDDLGLSLQSVNKVRSQLRKFIDQQIAPNDLVAIIRTSGTVGALQQFTTDRRLLNQALKQVTWNMCSRSGTTIFAAVGSESAGCGAYARFRSVSNTMLTLRFVVEAMGELPGRKSLIVFSDDIPREEQDFTVTMPKKASGSVADDQGTFNNDPGADNRSFAAQLQKIAEKAIRSSVVIYAVDSSGIQYTGLTAKDEVSISNRPVGPALSVQVSRGQQLLSSREGAEMIAKQTGGFLIRNSNNFELDRILEDQTGYYLIGYRPTDETFNRQFHHIKAKVKKSGMTLRTRYGFFGLSKDEANKTKLIPKDRVTLAMMSPFGTQDLPVDLTALFTNERSGSVIRTLVSVNPKDISFTTTADDKREASIQIRSMLFGNNGALVDQATYDRRLSMPGKIYEKALEQGILFRFDMPVKRPGSYQLRVAASDIKTSRVGSVGQFIEVPDLEKKTLAMSGIVISSLTTNGVEESVVSSAARRFAAGTTVRFACGIYNAAIDAGTHSPNVTLQIVLTHEGKPVLSSTELPVDTASQTDLDRLVATGTFRLDPNLESGAYFLQIIVRDRVGKPRETMQWVELEVVK
jgi:VWFA-related protein